MTAIWIYKLASFILQTKYADLAPILALHSKLCLMRKLVSYCIFHFQIYCVYLQHYCVMSNKWNCAKVFNKVESCSLIVYQYFDINFQLICECIKLLKEWRINSHIGIIYSYVHLSISSSFAWFSSSLAECLKNCQE